MGLWKLRLSIIGTLALIISLSTLAFTAILTWIGMFNLIALGTFIVFFNIIQWLMAPYIIDAIYHVRELKRYERPELHEVVDELSRKSGIERPKLMIAQMPIPNAFAYGSPIAGNRVAVTTGLLKTLESEEVEAVVGHEIGHLKHRDVQVMMFASLLPALLYFIGYSILWSSMLSRREGRGGGIALVGIACIALHWILQLFVLHLSRLREYFADYHSARIVEDGPRKLSEALAKIVYSSGRFKRMEQAHSLNAFKTLFISDPDHAYEDAIILSRAAIVKTSDQRLVQEILRRKITLMDRIEEIFSTHPNIVKRIRALHQLA